jgi:hypothetical protein
MKPIILHGAILQIEAQSFRGATEGGEPAIHNSRPEVMDFPAHRFSRRAGMTPHNDSHSKIAERGPS